MAKHARILIVDDDPNLLRMIGLILHRAGYDVHKAENGQEGLNKVKSLQPDLIILDVMMPGMDGFEVCRQLRSQPATRHLPVIILSALERVDERVKGFEAGADDYVSKPVDGRELVARTRALLHRASLANSSVARTIAFIGAKGGVGTTSVAVNVAATLTKQGKSTILAEIRPNSGAVRYHLKVDHNNHLGGLLALKSHQIRRPEVERCMAKHSSGMRLLMAPLGNGEQPLSVGHVETIFDVLSTQADYLILDLPPTIDGPTRRALELSDQILLVTEPDTLSVARAKAQVATLKEWGIFSRTDLVVVNRSQSTSAFNRVEVENKVGLSGGDHESASRWEPRALEVEVKLRQGVAAVIPGSPELFHEAVRESAPLVLIEPGSRPGRALTDLADWVSEKYELVISGTNATSLAGSG